MNNFHNFLDGEVEHNRVYSAESDKRAKPVGSLLVKPGCTFYGYGARDLQGEPIVSIGGATYLNYQGFDRFTFPTCDEAHGYA